MNTADKIKSEAERLYPLIITSGSICMDDVNMGIRQSRKDFTEAATFGASLKKNECESDHVSIDSLLSAFKRNKFNIDNWDGEHGAEEAFVQGVLTHIESLNGWIPVTPETMPKKEDADEDETIDWYFTDKGYRQDFYNDIHCMYNATHWRKIVKP